jgi:hypothetical protein
MSADDFIKVIDRVATVKRASQDEEEVLLAKIDAYEEYIRYMARGGVNAYHANKVAKIYMRELDISKQSPK